MTYRTKANAILVAGACITSTAGIFPSPTPETPMETRDANGTLLAEGDTVSVVKDLKVKGSSSVVKRGSVFKGIHLTDDPDLIEVRSKEIKGLVLRTEFVRKA